MTCWIFGTRNSQNWVFLHSKKVWVSTAWRIIVEVLQSSGIKSLCIMMLTNLPEIMQWHFFLDDTFYFTNDQCLKCNFKNLVLLLLTKYYPVPLCNRPWHDAWVIPHAHAITHTNQDKGGLGRQWKACPKVKLCGLVSHVLNSKKLVQNSF